MQDIIRFLCEGSVFSFVQHCLELPKLHDGCRYWNFLGIGNHVIFLKAIGSLAGTAIGGIGNWELGIGVEWSLILVASKWKDFIRDNQ